MHDGVTYQRSMLIHNPILAKRYPTCLQLRYLNVSNYSYRFSFVLLALMCQGKLTGCFQNICSMVPGINTVIRRYLRHVHEMNEYRTDRVCLFVRWKDLDEIWYESYAIGVYPNAVYFSVLSNMKGGLITRMSFRQCPPLITF
jgi:hypothetical protein